MIGALGAVGRATRSWAHFPLMLSAASWGVVREAARWNAWRRTTRYEFIQTMRQTTAGGLATTLVTASLFGLGMVYEALYWLGVAGQTQLTGTVLVTVLLREITPLLVGIILLGRSGMLTVAQLGTMQTGGQVRAMVAQGIDPFLLLVMPRTLAFALGSFTLGILFAAAALVFGFIVSNAISAQHENLWSFLERVIAAMSPRDDLLVPAKLLVIGYLVGLSCCLTGLDAAADDELSNLLPRGFVRGIVVILFASILLTMAV